MAFYTYIFASLSGLKLDMLLNPRVMYPPTRGEDLSVGFFQALRSLDTAFSISMFFEERLNESTSS